MAFSSTSRSMTRESRFPLSGNDPHNCSPDPAVAGQGVFASEATTTALLLRFARRFTHRPCIGRIDTAHFDFVFRRRSLGYFQLLFRDLNPLVIPPFLAFLDVTLIRHLLPTFLAEIRAARQQETADHYRRRKLEDSLRHACFLSKSRAKLCQWLISPISLSGFQ